MENNHEPDSRESSVILTQLETVVSKILTLILFISRQYFFQFRWYLTALSLERCFWDWRNTNAICKWHKTFALCSSWNTVRNSDFAEQLTVQFHYSIQNKHSHSVLTLRIIFFLSGFSLLPKILLHKLPWFLQLLSEFLSSLIIPMEAYACL